MVSLSSGVLTLLCTFVAGQPQPCSLPKDSNVVVYASTGAGGVGDNSAAWTRQFFTWVQTKNPDLVVGYVEDASEISTQSCNLITFPDLKLWVQPGGSADNQTLSLGPGGRDNILNFADTPQGHILATCAGFYYMAGSYWWYDSFYPIAWAPHFWPTVEGPIVPIAAYPNYAPVKLSDGRTVLYWGGPTLGLNHTGSSVPYPGGEQLVSFDTPLLEKPLGAAFRYHGAHVKALFSSPHPEAVAGQGVTCSPPLPPGCITPAEQLANWVWLAKQLNDLTGESWVIPTAL